MSQTHIFVLIQTDDRLHGFVSSKDSRRLKTKLNHSSWQTCDFVRLFIVKKVKFIQYYL